MSKTKYLLVVDYLNAHVIRAVENLRHEAQWSNLEFLVLTRYPRRLDKYRSLKGPINIHIVECYFENDEAIRQAIAPFKADLVGVICRSDKDIQDLRRLVNVLPRSVLRASAKSLTIATNKRLMREAFSEYAPEITPHHLRVYDAKQSTINKIEQTLDYPVIIKPANLASSLLIQSCHNQVELKVALHKIFDLIDSIYNKEERLDSPEVIVEEYLEGDFYSVDAYVLKPQEIYTCPPVYYVPAKQMGIDDFFIYKRHLPTKLSKLDTLEAYKIVKKAINAVGLTYTSVHVELVLTKNGWKIIELGPRLGRFRHRMYNLAYGIDHSLNDVKLHLGLKPSIPTKLQNYSAGYSIYPLKEGTFKTIRNLKTLQSRSDLIWQKLDVEPGDNVKFAKHGGHALYEFVIADPGLKDFNQTISYIEKEVRADID